jgi:ABC-2 type transport system permease protein
MTAISLSRGLRRTSPSEWSELRTLRSAWITNAEDAVSTMMLALVAFAYDTNRWGEMSAAERDMFDPVSKSLVGVLLAALVLGALAVQSVISGTRQT